MLVSLVPVLLSLNRGVWIGLGLTGLFGLVLVVRSRRLAPLFLAGLIATAAVVIFSVTPASQLVNARLAHGVSNGVRADLDKRAVEIARSSPIVGYGSTRTAAGSYQSIAVGRSPQCPQCGNAPVGSTGQFWLLLVSNGLVGTILYLAYFGSVALSALARRTPIARTVLLIMILSFLYNFFYTTSPSTLAIYFASIGLLWKDNSAREPFG